MARHRLTRPDPSGRITRRGYLRRVQLPAGAREKQRLAARAHREKPRELLNARLACEADPIKRLEHALAYVKSAYRKYQMSPESLERLERAIVRAGDRGFAGGRRPAVDIANRRTRK